MPSSSSLLGFAAEKLLFGMNSACDAHTNVGARSRGIHDHDCVSPLVYMNICPNHTSAHLL